MSEDQQTLLPWRGFYEALRRGNVQHVKKCLEQNFDFRLPVAYKQSALEFAARHGQIEVVEAIRTCRDFRNLSATEKLKYLFKAFKASCRKQNVPMMTYFLNIDSPKLYNPSRSSDIRNLIFSLHLTEDDDGILDNLSDGRTWYPTSRDKWAPRLLEILRGRASGDRRIRRQEIIWMMRSHKLTFDQLCAALAVDPLFLQVCIGDFETVDKSFDDWIISDKFPEWCRLYSDKFGSSLGSESTDRPELAAVRSGRAYVLHLFLKKIRGQLLIDTGIENERNAQIWSNLVRNLACEHVADVTVLRSLPPEAFDLDGTIPDSDSYDCLPWFFLGRARGPGSREIRALLNLALYTQDPELFQFYVDRYRIPAEHICVSGRDEWYSIPEDKKYRRLDLDCYQIPSDPELKLIKSDNSSYQSNYVPKCCHDWSNLPIAYLSKFPPEMAVRYLWQRFGEGDSKYPDYCYDGTISRYFCDVAELLAYGDVHMIELMDKSSYIHWDDFVHADLLSGLMLDKTNKLAYLMPLPALEYLAVHYYARDPKPKRRPRCLNDQARPLHEFLGNFYYNEYYGDHGFKDVDYRAATPYAKEAIRLLFTRFSLGEDEWEDFRNDQHCGREFRAKREIKAPEFRNKRTERSEGIDTKPWYAICPRFPSRRREFPVGGIGRMEHFHFAKLLAIMDLHDLSLDFGPKMRPCDNYAFKEGPETRLMHRDFIIALCGSEGFYLHWKGVLKSMAFAKNERVKLTRRQQLIELLANVGVVIVDTDFYGGLLPRWVPRSDFQRAMIREHPDVFEERCKLSLAGRCRIAIHKILRKTPGFQSDKIKSLDLPDYGIKFLMFQDLKDRWDSVEYHRP